MYHAINQPIYQLRIMQSINLSTSYVCTMQSTNLSTTCVQNHAIDQSIYELYVMQLISTVEVDSRVILLLVNLCV